MTSEFHLKPRAVDDAEGSVMGLVEISCGAMSIACQLRILGCGEPSIPLAYLQASSSEGSGCRSNDKGLSILSRWATPSANFCDVTCMSGVLTLSLTHSMAGLLHMDMMLRGPWPLSGEEQITVYTCERGHTVILEAILVGQRKYGKQLETSLQGRTHAALTLSIE